MSTEGQPVGHLPENEHASVTHLAVEIIRRLTNTFWSGYVPGPNQSLLKREEIREILGKVRRIFSTQPVMVTFSPPANILGDIHGQFSDLLRWMREFSKITPRPKILCLGDYVDRGPQSIDLVVLLFCYKIVYPTEVFLLRGNHETRLISRNYGFLAECKRRFDEALWIDFQTVFDWMPLAAVIGGKILCMHGGLSPELKNLSQIEAIPRPQQCRFEKGYEANMVRDILWSDPNPNAAPGQLWEQNCLRKSSYMFSEAVVKEFCLANNLTRIIRAHQCPNLAKGYGTFAQHLLITIFSAPNYLGKGNCGATVAVDADMWLTTKIMKPKREED